LIHGTTWYGKEKYGFIPYSSNKEENEKLNFVFKQNKRIIDNLKLSDVPKLKQFIIDAFNEVKPNNMDLKGILKMYDLSIKKNYYLSRFIYIFTKEYDMTCKIFGKFYIKLAKHIKVYDFYTKNFIKIL
jgi:hypothetical protein